MVPLPPVVVCGHREGVVSLAAPVSLCLACVWSSALFLQRFAADIISVLAMTMSGERECLKYRLVGSQEELASWGHEYVR